MEIINWECMLNFYKYFTLDACYLVLIVNTLLIKIVDNDHLILFNQEIGSSDRTAFF